MPSAGMAALAVVFGGVALGFAASLWALAQQRVSLRLQRLVRSAAARTRAAVGERDALIGSAREALVVWGRDGRGPVSYSGAESLLDSCLKGAEATGLSEALDSLSEHGEAFEMNVHDALGRKVRLRGRTVGGMAAVWLEPQAAPATEAIDYRAVLDALPIPVWLRDRALSLVWGNRAFLAAVGAADVDAAAREQAALESGEHDLASAARSQDRPLEERRTVIAGGRRKALAITEAPLEWGVVGAAGDVTELAATEARLQQHIDAHTDTLDKLATAVAIFDRDQKLSFYNRAFARLWDLPDAWLDAHPADGDFIDRLRDERKLPEQRDYHSWKRDRLKLYQTARDYPSEELWHLPNGKNLRVVAQPHPFGGLTFLFEDVTERISLASSYNTLIKVQSATLNNLREGVAAFGPDGKLKLHNSAFAAIWGLPPRELEGEPHIRAIADSCIARFGAEEIWQRLTQNIVSGAEVQSRMGEVERNDRSILSIGVSPLPDGAALATFADVTDRSRAEEALRERAEALEAADRLKSDFIKHVSYELRTPLNTILGFAEHLSTEVPGELNERQREYMQAIVSSSNTLKNLVNDILDLALVESGGLRLELTRIELSHFLKEIATYAGDWAAKAGLTLKLDCPEEGGEFLADERRLSQVAYNLVSNAFKYTPKGGIITLGGCIENEDVLIYVKDNGPGLAPEVRATVFERFSARGNANQRGGAGLGLALVNRFIQLHDGWVEIDDKDGTLVRCHLPRRLGAAPAATGDESARAAPAAE
jgi:signal transduction histidine kinase